MVGYSLERFLVCATMPLIVVSMKGLMMFDMVKNGVKVGDKLRTRNGQTLVVSHVYDTSTQAYPYDCKAQDGSFETYDQYGLYFVDCEDEMDIVGFAEDKADQPTEQPSKAEAPNGYVLVHRSLLQHWGKLEELEILCRYPVKVTDDVQSETL